MVKKSLSLIAAGMLLAAAPVHAQAPAAGSQAFSATPQCSELINRSGYTIYGSVETARVQDGKGQLIHYKSNLRLGKDERTKICSSGPFFSGGKVELTLKTLMPVFSCQTKLGRPIEINAARREDDRGYVWSATCH